VENSEAATSDIVIRTILIDNIDVEKQQVRQTTQTEDIEELAMDIQRHGQLQPIGVQELPTGRYQLLWGRRRLEAHKYLHRRSVMARIFPVGDQSVKSIAIRENIHRLAMTLQEEVNAVDFLHSTEGRSPDEIAASLGKSRQWVMRRMAIPNLPLDVIDELMAGRLTLAAAEEVAKIAYEPDRAWMISAIHAARWTQAQVVQAVAQALNMPDVSEAVEAGLHAAQSQVQQTPLMMPCAACGKPRPLPELVLIRVCGEGCDHES
jgi:ParB/RepB/Spo0J family partition protein